MFTPLPFSGRDCRIHVNSSLNIWKSSAVKSSRFRDVFEGWFLMKNSISLVVIFIGIFKLSSTHWVSCASLYFSRNWSILSKLSNYGHGAAHSTSLPF